MADFFARLIDRAAGTAPVVPPRIPSTYAPVNGINPGGQPGAQPGGGQRGLALEEPAWSDAVNEPRATTNPGSPAPMPRASQPPAVPSGANTPQAAPPLLPHDTQPHGRDSAMPRAAEPFAATSQFEEPHRQDATPSRDTARTATRQAIHTESISHNTTGQPTGGTLMPEVTPDTRRHDGARAGDETFADREQPFALAESDTASVAAASQPSRRERATANNAAGAEPVGNETLMALNPVPARPGKTIGLEDRTAADVPVRRGVVEGAVVNEQSTSIGNELLMPSQPAQRAAAAPATQARQASERRAATQASEPAAPVIQVSIGRIDVRAVAPPQQQQQPQRPRGTGAPALSLEEYLRQRNGGTR